MVSPHREPTSGSTTQAIFRRMARANHDRIRHDELRLLADEVWDGAGTEIEQFLETASATNLSDLTLEEREASMKTCSLH